LQKRSNGRAARRAIILLPVVLLAAAFALWRVQHTRATTSNLSVWESPAHPGRYVCRFETMGTDARVMTTAPDLAAARRIIAAAVPKIQLVTARMSTYREDSEISELNRVGASRAVPLSKETYEVLGRAVLFSRLTDGAFDITYAPLRTLWRRAQQQDALPEEGELKEALLLVGSDGLILNDRTARFARAGMEVDLGGIAKGYAVDLAVEAMREAGARSGLVDIGGDLRLIGVPQEERPWKVKIVTPPGVDWEKPRVLHLGESAVVTSGDYERYFTIGKEKMSHIFDPRTGRPVRSVPSATVLAPTATDADALATAISVMGPEEGIALIDSLDGVECMIVSRDEGDMASVHYSRGFRPLLKETD